MNVEMIQVFTDKYGVPIVVFALVIYGLKQLLDKTENKYNWLFSKVMEDNDNREKRYLDTIDGLTDKLNIVTDVKKTIDEVKTDIQYLKGRVNNNE